jgi:hypothetical protein
MSYLLIEPLESRIAPATLVNPLTVTYTDVDNDFVTISVSHGDLTGKVIFEGAFGDNGPQQLKQINLTSPAFAHASVTITAGQQTINGNALANFGVLNAAGVVLGDVNISGDVGKIVAGGLGNLTLHALGNSSDLGAPNFNSAIKGSVGNVHIIGDVNKAAFAVKGTMGNLTVDGSINGGTTAASGSITASTIGNISMGGSINGGGLPSTGLISVTGNVGTVSLNTLQGGGGTNSGRIYVGGNMGAVTVSALVGGAGDGSGSIEVKGSLASFFDYNQFTGSSGKRSGSLVVHGSCGTISCSQLTGGSNLQSGFIRVDGGAGQIHAYSITGGSGASSAAISVGGALTGVDTSYFVSGGTGVLSGSIRATGLIGSVAIGTDLTGGSATDAGSISSIAGLASVTIGGNLSTNFGVGSGAISTNGNLGAVTVHGSVTGTAGHPVIISALGTNVTAPGGSTSATIDSLTVDGSASFLNVLAGYDVTRKAVNADAQIGTISIGTTVKGSNFVAGAIAGSKGFGSTGTKAISGGNANVLSKIANVIIGGQSVSTTDSDDHYAIVAQQVSGVSVNGAAKTLTAGPNNDHGLALGAADDFTLQEVA